jgi:hypothetical protein
MNNAILVSETNGVVTHHFCDATFAQGMLEYAKVNGTGDSAFFQDEDTKIDVATVYELSPDLRNRVEAAKDKLREDIRIRNAMDKHGVPKDRTLRAAVYKAFKELHP